MNKLEKLNWKYSLTEDDLKKFIEILPNKERIIIQMRFGFGDFKNSLILKEVAQHFNVSSQCISIFEDRALIRIKRFKELYSKVKG